MLALLLVCLPQAPEAPAPIDPDLADATTRQAVFVRMRDQLFALGDEYEAHCLAHATTPRSRLRARALADLRERAARAQAATRDGLARAMATGHVGDVEHFWIVNGFAAMADGDGVRALATLPGVAWVHRQTQPGAPQQRHPRRAAAWCAERERDESVAHDLLQARGTEAPFLAGELQVPWTLQAIRADAAWATGATGSGVVIALVDSGILAKAPLVHALWQNPRETPNGVDDDDNGFVDDLYGWDFDGDTRFVVGDGEQSHGTMCGGILAGRPFGTPATVTGVAPRARLMVLRGMGRLRGYEYAAAMGADVLSMSYMWTDVELGSYRGVFRTAHEHLAACGVVAVGGAGNFGRTMPAGRQITLPKDIPCVIAAAGIGENGEVPAFSSRGPCTWHDVPFFADFPPTAPLPKPDVCGCAAGFPVWHWTQSRGRPLRVHWQDGADFGLVTGPQGNSFAGPHAGGVAALVLSVQPELTPWRVQQLLAASCKDLGEAGHDTTTGAGLLQADAAVALARRAKVE